MWNLPLYVIAIAVLIWPFAALAQEEEPPEGEALSRMERMQRGMDRMFDRFDNNGDGQIDQSDLEDTRAGNFAAVDTDGDGSISADELIQHQDARRLARVERHLERMDRNGDGSVTEDEFGDRRQHARRGERSSAASLFERFDQDEDGVVTRDETHAWAEEMGRRMADRYERHWRERD